MSGQVTPPTRPEGAIVTAPTIGGIAQHYQVSGTGTPVLLAAGMGGVGAYWAPQVPVLSAQYQVITYDQRGTGRSAHVPVESIEQLAEDAIALLDHLGLERVHFIGHSTGGAIGQVVALRAPERLLSLTLYASVHRADAFRRKIWSFRREVLKTMGPCAYAAMTTLALYPPWFIAEHEADLRIEEERTAKALAAPEIMASRISAILSFDVAQKLPAVRVPTMVVCARDDALTPSYFSEEMARSIPGAHLELVNGGAHALSRTRPELFNKLVLEFLGAQKAARP
jgi:aminoacrylate hydrolase